MDNSCPLWKWTFFVTLVGSSLCENFQLIILHNNDMHARFEKQKGWGGFARTAHYIASKRKEAEEGKIPPVIYLNAGDTFTGTVWFSVHKWGIAAEFVKMLKPDVMALGNHEFDNGIEEMCQFVENCGSPVVCANCNFTKEPKAEKLILPSHVLTINDTKIGVIGYVLPETKDEANPGQTTFINEIEAIRKEAQILLKEGVNILIALGHSGYDRDQEIAAGVPEIDVVVGGHTHSFLWPSSVPMPSKDTLEGPYPTIVKRSGRPDCPIVQAYAYTKYFGHLSLVFDEKGDVLEIDKKNTYVVYMDESRPEDPEVLNLLTKYRPEVDKLRRTIIGRTEVDLAISACRLEECNIANMVLDAFIDYKALRYNGSEGWTDCPIALINGGGLRSAIRAGYITQSNVYTALPFFQKLLSFEIYGHQIKKSLEVGVRSDLYRVEGEFLQVSGIHYTFDRKRPVGHRVSLIKVRCARCDVPKYELIEFNRLYRLITINFLASGGNGHYTLKNRKNTIVEDTYDTQVVEEYLRFHEIVRPEVETRITAAISVIGQRAAGGCGFAEPLYICILFLNAMVLFLYFCVNVDNEL